MMMRVSVLWIWVALDGFTPAPRSPVVAVASPDKLDYIADQQSLHADDGEVYIGALFEMTSRHLRVLTTKNSGDDLSGVPMRILMAHRTPRGTRLLLVVDRAHERPVIIWWDRARRSACIPYEVAVHYRLESALAKFRKKADGAICPLS